MIVNEKCSMGGAWKKGAIPHKVEVVEYLTLIFGKSGKS
jgi:hypothetical protein